MNIFRKAVGTFARNLGLTSPTLLNFYSGGPTASGEVMSVDAALQLEVVWACVRLISGTVATLPCHFYQKDSLGRGSIAYDHPLYALLHDLANADMTAVVFWEALVGSLMMWGNAYASIDRVGGRVVALTPLRPDRVYRFLHPDGSTAYRYTYLGQVHVFEEGEMMHVKGFSLDGIIGLSPVGQARETLGLARAAEKTAASLFRNSMRPSAVASLDTFLDDARRKRFEEETLPRFVGSMNAGKVPLLEGGIKITALALTPEDAELLSTRQFSISQICRWFGVQPVMIGHMDKTSSWGSGLEQMNQWFLTYTLRPILLSIEQEIYRALLTPVERTKFYAEFNVDGLLRADSVGRANQMKMLIDAGLRTPNELRGLDNFPPLPGGDDLTMMSNRLPIEMLGEVARLTANKATGVPFTPAGVAPDEGQGTETKPPAAT